MLLKVKNELTIKKLLKKSVKKIWLAKAYNKKEERSYY